jgi:hypothetical protein
VELMGKEKGYNSSKVLRKLSQWFIKGFQNGMMEGKKMESFKKGFWCWSVFLLSKYWLPFYLKRFLELFSLSLSLSPCSISWGLGGFDDIRGKNSLL